MHPLESLLRKSYDAFNARDLDTTLKALGPNVVWPNQLEGSILHGPAAVGAYWQLQWKVLNPHYDLKNFKMDEQGTVTLTLIQTVRGADGHIISEGLVRHIYEFEDELVRRMTILL